MRLLDELTATKLQVLYGRHKGQQIGDGAIGYAQDFLDELCVGTYPVF